MSIFKSFTIAALTFGIASGAVAAKNEFIAPDAVKDIVSGNIQSRIDNTAEEQRLVVVTYALGFAGALDYSCNVLDGSTASQLGDFLRQAIAEREAAKRAGHNPAPETLATFAGYLDGKKLAEDYGCGSRVGVAATRAVRHMLAN